MSSVAGVNSAGKERSTGASRSPRSLRIPIIYLQYHTHPRVATVLDCLPRSNLHTNGISWSATNGPPLFFRKEPSCVSEKAGRRASGLRRRDPRREAIPRQDTPHQGRIVPAQVWLLLPVSGASERYDRWTDISLSFSDLPVGISH